MSEKIYQMLIFLFLSLFLQFKQVATSNPMIIINDQQTDDFLLNLNEYYYYNNPSYSVFGIFSINQDNQFETNFKYKITNSLSLNTQFQLKKSFSQPLQAQAPTNQLAQVILTYDQMVLVIFDSSQTLFPLLKYKKFYLEFNLIEILDLDGEHLQNKENFQLNCYNFNFVSLKNIEDTIFTNCHLKNDKTQKFLLYNQMIYDKETNKISNWSKLYYMQYNFKGENSKEADNIIQNCSQPQLYFINFVILIYCPYEYQTKQQQTQNTGMVFFQYPFTDLNKVNPSNTKQNVTPKIIKGEDFGYCYQQAAQKVIKIGQVIVNPQLQNNQQYNNNIWDFLFLKEDNSICKCQMIKPSPNMSKFGTNCYLIQLDLINNYSVMTYTISKNIFYLMIGSDQVVQEVQIYNDQDDQVGQITNQYLISSEKDEYLENIVVTDQFIVTIFSLNDDDGEVQIIKSFSRLISEYTNTVNWSKASSELLMLFQNNNYFSMGNFFMSYNQELQFFTIYQLQDQLLEIYYDGAVPCDYNYLEFYLYLKIDWSNSGKKDFDIKKIPLFVLPYEMEQIIIFENPEYYNLEFQTNFITIEVLRGIIAPLIQYQYDPTQLNSLESLFDYYLQVNTEKNVFNQFFKNNHILYSQTISTKLENGFYVIGVTQNNPSQIYRLACLVSQIQNLPQFEISTCTQNGPNLDFSQYLQQIDQYQQNESHVLIIQETPYLQMLLCLNNLFSEDQALPFGSCWPVDGPLVYDFYLDPIIRIPKKYKSIKLLKNNKQSGIFVETLSENSLKVQYFEIFFNKTTQLFTDFYFSKQVLLIDYKKISALNNQQNHITSINSNFLHNGQIFILDNFSNIYVLSHADEEIYQHQINSCQVTSQITVQTCTSKFIKHKQLFVIQGEVSVSSLRLMVLCYGTKTDGTFIQNLIEYTYFNPFKIELRRQYPLYQFVVQSGLQHFQQGLLVYIGVQNYEGSDEYSYLVVDPNDFTPNTIFYQEKLKSSDIQNLQVVPVQLIQNQLEEPLSLNLFVFPTNAYLHFLNYNPKFYGTSNSIAEVNTGKNQTVQIIVSQSDYTNLHFIKYDIKFNFLDSHIQKAKQIEHQQIQNEENSHLSNNQQQNTSNNSPLCNTVVILQNPKNITSNSQKYQFNGTFTLNPQCFTGPIQTYEGIYPYQLKEKNQEKTEKADQNLQIQWNPYIQINKFYSTYQENLQIYGKLQQILNLDSLSLQFTKTSFQNLVIVLTSKKLVFIEKIGFYQEKSFYHMDYYDSRIICRAGLYDLIGLQYFNIYNYLLNQQCQITLESQNSLLIYCSSQTSNYFISFKYSYIPEKGSILLYKNTVQRIFTFQVVGIVQQLIPIQYMEKDGEDGENSHFKLSTNYNLIFKITMINNQKSVIFQIGQITSNLVPNSKNSRFQNHSYNYISEQTKQIIINENNLEKESNLFKTNTCNNFQKYEEYEQFSHFIVGCNFINNQKSDGEHIEKDICILNADVIGLSKGDLYTVKDFDFGYTENYNYLILVYLTNDSLMFQKNKNSPENKYQSVSKTVKLKIKNMPNCQVLYKQQYTFIQFLKKSNMKDSFDVLLGTEEDFYEMNIPFVFKFQNVPLVIVQNIHINYTYRKYYMCKKHQGNKVQIFNNDGENPMILSGCYRQNEENPYFLESIFPDQITTQNFYVQLYPKYSNQNYSWPVQMIMLPYFEDNIYQFVSYQTPKQKGGKDMQLKLLVSNCSYFLVDYNISSSLQIEFQLNVKDLSKSEIDYIEKSKGNMKLVNSYSYLDFDITFNLINNQKIKNENFLFIILILVLSLTLFISLGIIICSIKSRKSKKNKNLAKSNNKKQSQQITGFLSDNLKEKKNENKNEDILDNCIEQMIKENERKNSSMQDQKLTPLLGNSIDLQTKTNSKKYKNSSKRQREEYPQNILFNQDIREQIQREDQTQFNKINRQQFYN